MTLPYSIYLTLKYLKPKRSIVTVINLFSVVAVSIGVAVLIVIISVMAGFDDMWRDKILKFQPHIVVMTGEPIPAPDKLAEEIRGLPGVVGAVPYIETEVVLAHDRYKRPAMIRATDLWRDKIIQQVSNHVERGRFLLDPEECLIGYDLARTLGVQVGDEVVAFTIHSIASDGEIRLPDELTVAGIFNVGMYEIDKQYVVTTLETGRDLLGYDDEADGISVFTEDIWQADKYMQQVKKTVGPLYWVRSWRQMHQHTFDSLEMEKNMMFFVLLFITAIASLFIMVTLIILVIQKMRDIGLQQAVGVSSGQIMRTFLLYGATIGTTGVSLGLGLGLLIVSYRNPMLVFMRRTTNFELFPKEVYGFNELPATVDPGDLTSICLSAFVLCLFASIIPAYYASRLHPVKALRHD
jgi:lipoprotein-releasing system permease protein